MSSGWFYLAAMVAAYGVANLLQSVAVSRMGTRRDSRLGLLVRLVAQRVYVLGLLCQLLGFVLAFLARRDLPLFLVQACMAAGLGVTAVLGVVVLKWRLPRAEMALLVVLGGGLLALILSADPAPSRQIGPLGVTLLWFALAGVVIAGMFAVRLPGVRGSMVLGCLAGLSFGAAALASRPLGNVDAPASFVTDPLLYALIAHSLCGTLLLALGMRRGSTMAAIAGMDAATTVPAAVGGLLFLGDRVVPGLEWLAGLGFLVTLSAVLALTRYSQPQTVSVPADRSVDCESVGAPN